MRRLRYIAFLALLIGVLALAVPFQALAHHRSGHQGGPSSGEPSPSPSASDPSPSPSSSEEKPSQAAAASQLTVALDGPAQVARLDQVTLSASVANAGDEDLERAELELNLPAELTLLGSEPPAYDVDHANDGGSRSTYLFGTLEPGETVTVEITAEAAAVTSSALVAAQAAGDGAQAADDMSIEIVEADVDPSGLAVTSRSDFLAQVGETLDYRIKVSNTTAQDIADVVVIDLVPGEVEVGGVGLPDGVDGVQLGDHRGRQDIVWNVGILEAGTSVDLTWTGVARQAGDLEAENVVQAKVAQRVVVEESDRTFLGAAEKVAASDPRSFEPIRKRVVVYRPAPDSAQPSVPGVLPATGISPWLLVIFGWGLVLVGVAFVVLARVLPPVRTNTVLLALCLAVAGCVSSESDRPTSAPSETSTDGDQVLGTRITNSPDDGDQPSDEGEEGDVGDLPEDDPTPDADPDGDAGPGTGDDTDEGTDDESDVAAPPAPPVELQPVVTTVVLGLDDLPVDTLESRDGDNAMSYVFDEASGKITQATSGVRFDPDQSASIMTSVSTDAQGIQSHITLTNLADARRLAVSGRLVHEVFGAAGELLATFESEHIDVVLAPGGRVEAPFSYLLPSGDYSVEASFRAEK